MKFFLFLLLFLFSPTTILAQNVTDQTRVLGAALSAQQLNEALRTNRPISGAHIVSLLPQRLSNPCAELQPMNAHYEVVLVTQQNLPRSPQRPPAQVSAAAANFANTMLRTAAQSSGPEQSTVSALANLINASYRTDETKFDALVAFSERLSQSCNIARGPGPSTPRSLVSRTLSSRRMTFNQLLLAAERGDRLEGRACSDISQVVARIGARIFPSKDILVINQGTRHGVVVSNGGTNQIIGGHTQQSMAPAAPATNMHIHRVDEHGGSREIAVVNSETGHSTESPETHGSGGHAQRPVADIQRIISDFNVFHSTSSGVGQELNATVGSSVRAQSRLYVVVARYKLSSGHTRFLTDIGARATGSGSDTDALRYQLRLSAGPEYGIIRYASPSLRVNLSAALRVQGMLGPVESQDHVSPVGVEASARADISARVGPTTISAEVSLAQTLGHTDLSVHGRVTTGSGQLSEYIEAGYGHGAASILAGVQAHLPGAQLIVFGGYSGEIVSEDLGHALSRRIDGALVGASYQRGDFAATVTGNSDGVQCQLEFRPGTRPSAVSEH
jgi:hypothetical protein